VPGRGAKFAVEGLMQSLAPVAARFNIDVSIVEPAAVGSEFVGNVAGTTTPGRDDPYAGLLAAYLKRTEGAFAAASQWDTSGPSGTRRDSPAPVQQTVADFAEPFLVKAVATAACGTSGSGEPAVPGTGIP
jgi:NAD(P)-dependent dehydrogenase (short-subunit alcohol dehydrogenase family)